MSDKKFDDGGPLHPGIVQIPKASSPEDGIIADGQKEWVQSTGASIWDYFAGQAMAAIINKIPPFSNNRTVQSDHELLLHIEALGQDRSLEIVKAVAVAAGRYADAMIAERNKRLGK